MGLRSFLRLLMVALAAGVGLLVYVQWEPEAGAGSEPENRPQLEIPEGEREIESVSHALRVSQTGIGGREEMWIEAERLLDYADGWNIWEGPDVMIMGRQPESTEDDVHVVADTMRTTGEMGDFTEVRFIGNVRAELPGEAVFETRRVDYDAVSGVASNCNRNILGYGGLQVGSDCLEFLIAGDPGASRSRTAEQLRMWGNLVVEASPAGGEGLPPGLRGSAAELRFRPGGEEVTLEGEPVLRFEGTLIQGETLRLDVGSGARQLRQVAAETAASVRMGVGDDTDDDRITALTGEQVVITFGSGARPETVLATGSGPRLRLPGRGTLAAARIELVPAGGSRTVRATGDAEWEAWEGGAGPERLQATTLDLTLSGEQLETLEATGSVAARMDSGEAGGWRFGGPSLEMEWEPGAAAPTRATWPDGVELEQGGRRLSASEARFADGEWTLSGDPRPRASSPEIELAANEITVSEDGETTASGEVSGTLSGAALAAGAVLFGDIPGVSFESDRVVLHPGGKAVLRDSVQVVWESQSLVTDQLMLEPDPGRLRARREVELVAVADPETTSPDFVTIKADDLLVEQASSEIHAAGSARLRFEELEISAERMAVVVDESGLWNRVEAVKAVELGRPGMTASGERLEYTMDSGDMLLLGSDERPATFVYDELEYRSTEALRVRWEGEDVIIEATEDGRTRTKVVSRQDEGESGG